MIRKNALSEKLQEAVDSVLPIALIVSLLCFFFVPVGSGLMLSFLVGTVMIIAGMALFTLGSEQSMSQIGNLIGARLTKSRNIWLILALSFIMGVVITVAEPDLQVLATNVPGIDRMALIATVSVGVGLFLAVSMVRILLGIPLRWLLLAFYGLVFVLAFLSDPGFLAVSFDSGGVTTGPMTVPFIMALGVGLSASRTGPDGAEDSFGLVALCSVGPILMVLLLGIFYHPEEAVYSFTAAPEVHTTQDVVRQFVDALPRYAQEVLICMLPIVGVLLVFQIFTRAYRKRQLLRMAVGLAYTIFGLILFLTGVNVGFAPVGTMLGEGFGSSGVLKWTLIPIGVAIGYYLVKAEPAVQVLNQQVEDVTGGTVTRSMMNLALSIGVACAVALSMVRVLTGLNLYWVILPGYAAALLLGRKVPQVFVGIAFDSGGVASGPMTSTFLLPLAMGACTAVGGNVVTDAFGVVALVALAPLIAIQIMGLVYEKKTQNAPAAQPVPEEDFVEFEEDSE